MVNGGGLMRGKRTGGMTTVRGWHAYGQDGQEMAVDPMVTHAHVATPAGRVVGIPEGGRLVFGRGPDVDLIISAGRGLSRRAGVISALAGGVLVANISITHALYA